MYAITSRVGDCWAVMQPEEKSEEAGSVPLLTDEQEHSVSMCGLSSHRGCRRPGVLEGSAAVSTISCSDLQTKVDRLPSCGCMHLESHRTDGEGRLAKTEKAVGRGAGRLQYAAKIL